MNSPFHSLGRRLTAVGIVVASLGVLVAGSRLANAQSTIQPLHDIEGSWKADASRQMQCFRAETGATCVMVNQGFSHKFDLVYTSPTKLEGTVTRRNRTKPCVTHMNIVMTMSSAAAFTLTWKALDSSCDLTAGQSATDLPYARVL